MGVRATWRYGPHGGTGHMAVDYVTSGADMSKSNLGACAFIKLVVCGHQIGVCIERLPFFFRKFIQSVSSILGTDYYL